MKRYPIIFVVSAALFAITPAHAVKLYKWIGPDGSTHYHQDPPPKGTQFVEEKDFDGQTNVVPSPETEAAMNPGPEANQDQPGAPVKSAKEDAKQSEDANVVPLTPEELTAIAQQGGEGATESSGAATTAPGAAGSGAGATGAGAAGAPGASAATPASALPPVAVPLGP